MTSAAPGVDEASLICENDQLCPVTCGELGHRPRDMSLGGCLANNKLSGDLRIGHPSSHQRQDFALTIRKGHQQANGIRSGGGSLIKK